LQQVRDIQSNVYCGHLAEPLARSLIAI